MLKIPRLSRLEQCRVIGTHAQPDRLLIIIWTVVISLIMMMMMLIIVAMIKDLVTFRWEHALRGRELRELEESSVTQLLLSNVWVCHTMMKKCDYREHPIALLFFYIYPLFHFLLR